MAALQLQHDAGLITSNMQVLGQFGTSLNRMSSEAMRLAFGKVVFPSDASASCALHDGHGFVATAGWPGRSRAIAGFIMQ